MRHLSLLLLAACAAPAPRQDSANVAELFAPEQVTPALVRAAAARGVDTIVLDLTTRPGAAQVAAAAAHLHAAALRLGYWMEIARDPELAQARPEWMASLQGHDEWREAFPDAPLPEQGEITKAWPWIPLASEETYAAHRERVRAQLAALPRAGVIFLSDLQGAPSACGCGSPICRWTSDYAMHGAARRSTAPLGPGAAASFVAEVAAMSPGSEVIPVWVTECESADAAAGGACHGVGCYRGACWREFDRQWLPLRKGSTSIALLLPYRAFARDLPRFGADAGWIAFAITHLRERCERVHGAPLPAASLIAVIQAWDPEDDVPAQRQRAREAGVERVLVARTRIEQSFEPRSVSAR